MSPCTPISCQLTTVAGVGLRRLTRSGLLLVACLLTCETAQVTAEDGFSPIPSSIPKTQPVRSALVSWLKVNPYAAQDVETDTESVATADDADDDAGTEDDANQDTNETEDDDQAEPSDEDSVQPEGDRLGGESIFGGDAKRSPAVQGSRFQLPPLMAATTQTSEIGNGKLPEGYREGAAQTVAALPESGVQRGYAWDWATRTWAAPNTFSHPRYFEDRMLERHGYERFPYLQPLASGARFFGTVPLLPYLTTIRNPCDCEYQMGYFRPGSCVPAYLQRPPFERRAVIAEGASVAKGVLLIP